MNGRHQQGMALVMVLWLVVLLGVMAAGHARNTRTETRLAARQVDYAAARATAEAAINHVILEMLTPSAGRQHPVDGTVFPVEIAGRSARLAIRDARGLVDLNAADAWLLNDLLRACDVQDNRRAALIDAILDWRDGDSLTHLNGVEDGDYAAAGLDWTARDGAFRAIEEVRYVIGMDQTLYECIAPLITVHARRGAIAAEYAPPRLLRALGGEPKPARPVTPRSGVRTGTYHIYSTAAGSAGAVAALEAVVRLSAGSASPVRVLDWREAPIAVVAPAREEST